MKQKQSVPDGVPLLSDGRLNYRTRHDGAIMIIYLSIYVDTQREREREIGR